MLSVLGIGMVSASGARARDHAFYARAEAPPPVASPFYRVDGRRWEVRRCPWVAPLDDVAARMLALAKRAASEALASLPDRPPLALYLCAPAPRAGLSEAAIAKLAEALGSHVRANSVTRLVGEASVLGTLESMRFEGVALVVAVDGFVSLADATESVRHPPCPWLLEPLTPGEGAGALLLTRAQPKTAIARIVASSSAMGAATDDNDEPIDAAAMTDVMAKLALGGQVGAVFGQGRVDHLRLNEWERMVPRLAERFHMTHYSACLEAEVGRTGSASGVMSLCYAIACLRHRALPRETPEGPVVAWALSRDGLRAAAVVESDRQDALVALDGKVHARGVERQRFTPPEIEEEIGFVEDEEEVFDADEEEAAREIEALLEAEKAIEETDDIAPMPRQLPRGVEPLPLVNVRALPATSLEAFYEGVVVHCAETAAMLVQDRFEGPWSEVSETERRLLCQVDAVVATGGNALSTLVRAWESDIEDAWSAYASTLLLLAFAGEDVLEALEHAIAHISEEDVASVRAVSEAIALSDAQLITKAWMESKHAPARAIAIALSGLGAVDPQAVAQALTDESLLVRRAAVWACDALPPEEHRLFAPYLEAAFDFPEGYSAARQLALWGDASGVARLDALGPMGAELLVLAGRAEDARALDDLLQQHEPSAQLIDSVARFGSPRSLPWLLGLLVHPDLADVASAGLTTFLGPIERALDTTAWQATIDAMALDRGRRYRRGRPWSPAIVIEECSYDGASRLDLEKRSDELRARLGIAQAPRLWRWHPEAQRELGEFLAVARRGR